MLVHFVVALPLLFTKHTNTHSGTSGSTIWWQSTANQQKFVYMKSQSIDQLAGECGMEQETTNRTLTIIIILVVSPQSVKTCLNYKSHGKRETATTIVRSWQRTTTTTTTIKTKPSSTAKIQFNTVLLLSTVFSCFFRI